MLNDYENSKFVYALTSIDNNNNSILSTDFTFC